MKFLFVWINLAASAPLAEGVIWYEFGIIALLITYLATVAAAPIAAIEADLTVGLSI